MVAIVVGVLLFGCSLVSERQSTSSTKTEVGLRKAEQLISSYGGNSVNLDEARVSIDQALAANPDDTEALSLLARWTLQSGRFSGMVYDPESVAEAIRIFERALALDPKRADIRVHLAYAYIYSTYQQDKALEQLAMAEKLDPMNPAVDLAYTLAYRLSNDWVNVKARLQSARKKAARSNENSSRIKFNIVYAQLSVDRNDRNFSAVSKGYEELMTIMPNSAWTLGDYANHLLMNVGDTDKAILIASKAIAIMNYPQVRQTLGLAYQAKWASLKSSDPKLAQEYLEKGKSLLPDPERALARALASVKVNPDLKALSLELRSSGLSIDAVGPGGETALVRAVRWQKIDEIRDLLDQGANPDQTDSNGNPLVTVALSYSNGLLEALIEHGANLEVGNQYGQRPLHLAALGNNLEAARLLLAHHVEVNPRSFGDRTPLLIAAAQKNSLEMVKLLVAAGADPNLVDEGGNSAERLASLAGNEEVASWLHSLPRTP